MNIRKAVFALIAGLAFATCPVHDTKADIEAVGPPGIFDAAPADTDRLFHDMKILRLESTATPTGTGLSDLDGRAVSLSEFKGKIIFVNFWTTWCGGCREEMPSMEKLHNLLKDRDFIMVAIDIKQPASWVRAFFEKHKLTFTPLLDKTGKTGDKFGVRALPTTFIIDKEGGIIGKAFGPRSWDSKASVALFEELMK